MNIKLFVKKLVCPFQRIIYGIKNSKGFFYIGKSCKLVGTSNIYFEENVSIMPYTMLVAHGNNSKITIGQGLEIGMFSRVAALANVTFGEYVLTGPHVFIADYNHEYSDINKPIIHQGNNVKKTASFPSGGEYWFWDIAWDKLCYFWNH